MGVSRLTVSELADEQRGLSADMAMWLALLLRTAPESWMRMQEAVDLSEMRRRSERFVAVQPLPKELLVA